MFWDSSALVPILLPEERTSAVEGLANTEEKVTIWWGSPVECQSAISRHRRQGPLSIGVLDAATDRLTRLLGDAHTISATDELRDRARRLVTSHPLRASDAFQLAAALVWCVERPSGELFVCLDDRLREAARREGFTVVPA